MSNHLKKRRRRIGEDGGNADAHQLMMLSLFIMMLAFFVVLNGTTSFDEGKTNPVMNSLTLAFSTNTIHQDFSPSVVDSPQKSIRQGQTSERLDALFQSQIAGFKPNKDSANGVMKTYLSLEDFARAVMAIGQKNMFDVDPNNKDENAQYFLPTLISLLRADQTDAPYQMTLTFHTKIDPAAQAIEDPERFNRLIRRINTLSTRIIESGLPHDLLRIGVAKGNTKTLALSFTPYRGEE